ncbi:methyltransferase [Colletotrichum orchidophilum]|uniref:Methyltransferase n=1 Tax=Colletotrichum orchidophilum TaxID=1209926 RepID=A0A1G4AW18_9PEZI|nr:methyltransferase [Colletotrichum orchidophilum]OHE93334.1 methyltransferase [Colletotrichum orchidophilum]
MTAKAKTNTTAGAAIYVPILLRYIYDPVVLGFYCPQAWRITSKSMREFFNRHIASASARSQLHNLCETPGALSPCRILDIGVGTGYFLKHAPIAAGSEVFLADLNPAALAAAKARTLDAHPQTTCETSVADFLDPVGKGLCRKDLGGGDFDAISVMMLLHCVPGPPSKKAEALTRLRHLLAPGGTLFGMTILGRGVRHNLLGRRLMFWHNLLGVFGNAEDDVEGIVGPLMEVFETVKWEVCGTMLLFEASTPKTPDVGEVY